MIKLSLNPDSPVPLYAQIVDQIRQAIIQGALKPGQALPTVRHLAVELRINLHTVAHAYAELAREGLVAVQRGRGTFVQGLSEPPDPQERSRRLLRIIHTALGEAAALGYQPEEFLRELEAHLQAEQNADES